MRLVKFLLLVCYLTGVQAQSFSSSSALDVPEYRFIALEQEWRDDKSWASQLQEILNLPQDEALVQDHVIHSPGGIHITYNHLAGTGMEQQEVLFSGVKLHALSDGRTALQIYLFDLSSYPSWTDKSSPYLLASGGQMIGVTTRQIGSKTAPELAYVNAQGQTLHTHQAYRNFKDTSAHALVFLGNPVNAAGTQYGGAFVDNNDQTNDSLDHYRYQVLIPVRMENDSFYPHVDSIVLQEISGPFYGKLRSDTAYFGYDRSQQEFEVINTFYHILNYMDFLHQLGYGLIIREVKVDAHALNGSDNSRFIPGDYSLQFGDGGVDDAEDAEVIIHEYVHSMSETASPNTVEGNQREAMEEGNCDYLAKAYSRGLSDYNSYKMFSWDGHNPFWNGFILNDDRIYPDDLRGFKDGDRELWSSTLMCIHDRIGRAATDSLVVEHLYYQFPNATMGQMANVLMQLDTTLFQNRYYSRIKACMVAKGFAEWGVGLDQTQVQKPVLLTNSHNFHLGLGNLLIESQEEFNLRIYNAVGALVMEVNHVDKAELFPEDWNKGMYVLIFEMEDQIFSQKILR